MDDDYRADTPERNYGEGSSNGVSGQQGSSNGHDDFTTRNERNFLHGGSLDTGLGATLGLRR